MQGKAGLVSSFNNLFSLIILISIGALFGATLRVKILDFLEFRNFPRFISIFIVNTISTFILGYYLGIDDDFLQLSQDPVFALLSIGFLGSLSTFSALIEEVSLRLRNKKWLESAFICFVSLFFALISAQLGYRLAFNG